MTERVPAKVWHLGDFLREEMDTRGWSVADVVRRMPGDATRNTLAVELILAVRDPGMTIGDDEMTALAAAFGVSREFFVNLDAAWRRANPV